MAYQYRTIKKDVIIFRKPGTGGVPYGGKALNYDEVFRQSSATNTTVYIGGTTSSDEIVIRQLGLCSSLSISLFLEAQIFDNF